MTLRKHDPAPRAQPASFVHWMLPLMLALVAVTVLLSGRDLSQMFIDLRRGGGMYFHPAVPWIQRLVSLTLLLICAHRLFDHFAMHRRFPAPLLTWAVVTYWACTVAAPALFGANPSISHEYLYSLVISVAALVTTEQERERVLAVVRNALLLFLLASALMAVVNPPLALDLQYRQGLLPGVPRFGGLAPHPVAMGLFAQTFLLCLWVRPFSRRSLTLFGWALGLAVLFFAQSKTSWIAFLLCALAMLAVRHGGGLWRRMSDPRQGAFGVAVCLLAILLTAGLLGLVLFSDLGREASDFLGSSEGAQLMSMTGRDQIWVVAMEEWRASPTFGYGLTLWSDDYRASIRMPHATSAHNQFMDTLARSGTVGAVALVLYAVLLLVLSLRAARATGGLSIALFIALALRSVSEVPLVMLGYGTELFAHVLLIITLASSTAPRTAEARAARPHAPYRTAT
jgi:O-antigen ligase